MTRVLLLLILICLTGCQGTIRWMQARQVVKMSESRTARQVSEVVAEWVEEMKKAQLLEKIAAVP